jgi:hypothetical protein
LRIAMAKAHCYFTKFMNDAFEPRARSVDQSGACDDENVTLWLRPLA